MKKKKIFLGIDLQAWETWASPGFGRGGPRIFFQIWKIASREATCCAWLSHALC